MSIIARRTDQSDESHRAYYLTVVNQRWLSLRLDLMGTALTFAISMLALGKRTSILPAQTGLALSYILAAPQFFSWTVRQLADVENDMNSVERIVHYARAVEQGLSERTWTLFHSLLAEQNWDET